jgi:hypothetical protein
MPTTAKTHRAQSSSPLLNLVLAEERFRPWMRTRFTEARPTAKAEMIITHVPIS